MANPDSAFAPNVGAGRRPATLAVARRRRRPEVAFSTALFTVAILLASVAGATPADSPLRLLDLRWLARPGDDTFVVDGPADVPGPGVLRYLSVGNAATVTIDVDGQVVFSGNGQQWRTTVHDAWQNGVGEAPWAWPLAQRHGLGVDLAVPIPFADRLRVTMDKPNARLTVAGQHLAAPPTRRFGGPAWTTELNTALAFLGTTEPGHSVAPPVESWRGVYPLLGSTPLDREVALEPGGRANLLTLTGAGEIVGCRFEFHLPFFDRLRDLVVEIAPDGGPPTVRLPLVDLLGDMQPRFVLWNLTHGTWVAGIQMPADQEPWMVGWFRFPIPYADGLRIDLANRDPDLPQQLRARFQMLPGDPATPWRLCAGRRTIDLPRAAGDEAALADFPAAGRLAALTVFATGHQYVAPWLNDQDVWLADAAGKRLTGGLGFLPLGGHNYYQKPLNFAWSQPRYRTTTWMAAHRAFWLAPPAVAPGTTVRFRAGGPEGPTVAEAAALWYQVPPFAAAAIAARARKLPPYMIEPVPAEAPGGWAVEAEDLLPDAVASSGDVYVERRLARDMGASADAVLAWNAPRMGEFLDLFVITPPTPYVKVWVRAPGSPGGGRFAGCLVPADQAVAAPLWAPGADDFARRSRGDVDIPYLVDCFSKYPFQRQQRHYPEVYLRNPAPGGLARLRFVAAGQQRRFLVLDQVSMNPAPPLPAGWQALDAAVPVVPAGVVAEPLTVGRGDFHGGGGLRLVAPGPATVRLPLATPVPATAGDVLELRGAVVRGVWTAAGTEVAGVADWVLGPVAEGTATLDLVLITPAGGELLLNAWRFAPGAPQ